MLLDMESTGFCLGALERETAHILVDMELVRKTGFLKKDNFGSEWTWLLVLPVRLTDTRSSSSSVT